ncbi:MAG: diguanylate cyclase [Methylococcaceae bacterium]|nr:diguanylate cyclase [Methylococcaceae bacterium]
MLERLHEKVENSKRNEMPFSLLYISLTDFKTKHQMADYEMDTTLLKVVDSFKKDIRSGLDIPARVGEEDFLIAFPGVPLARVEIIADKIKTNIFSKIKTPRETAVDISIGTAEFTHHNNLISDDVSMGMSEIEALLNIAIGKCFESKNT